MIHSEIRRKVNDSDPTWRFGYYGNKPHYTYDEIINDSFESVKKLSNNAGHCKYQEMYHPAMGQYRLSRSYSLLAPANGMSWMDRHIVGPDLRPYNSYKPKQGEWRQVKERSVRSCERVAGGLMIPESCPLPLPLQYRRRFDIPTSTTRHENFARYWGGRARGLEYCQPFLYSAEDNYGGVEEERRHQVLPHSNSMIPSQPTVRHGRSLLSIPYVTVPT